MLRSPWPRRLPLGARFEPRSVCGWKSFAFATYSRASPDGLETVAVACTGVFVELNAAAVALSPVEGTADTGAVCFSGAADTSLGCAGAFVGGVEDETAPALANSTSELCFEGIEVSETGAGSGVSVPVATKACGLRSLH